MTVFALDFSGNRGDAAGSVSVVATPDLQPPTVQLTARATTVPGALLNLTASAADNRGISQVQFFVDGVKIATDTEAPYAAVFAVPATAPAGRALQLEARAIDFAGLEGTDSQQTQVVSTSSLAQGVVAGEVYDDTTGLPVGGAAIALTGRDAGGDLYTQTTTSDSRGRYLLRATEGSGGVHVTRAGWTRVDRLVDIVANKSVEILDARLTPITTGAAPINPVLGATLNGPQGSATSLIVPSRRSSSRGDIGGDQDQPAGSRGCAASGLVADSRRRYHAAYGGVHCARDAVDARRDGRPGRRAARAGSLGRGSRQLARRRNADGQRRATRAPGRCGGAICVGPRRHVTRGSRDADRPARLWPVSSRARFRSARQAWSVPSRRSSSTSLESGPKSPGSSRSAPPSRAAPPSSAVSASPTSSRRASKRTSNPMSRT